MVTVVKIQSGGGKDKEWRPDVFHHVHPDQVKGQDKNWWFQAVEGIQVLGEDKVRRTKGQPATLRRIRDKYGKMIEYAVNAICDHHGATLWPPEDAEELGNPEVSSMRSELIEGGWDQDAYARWDEARRLEYQILVAAMVAIESGGNPNAARQEPQINDASYGLCQTLTATALGIYSSTRSWGFQVGPKSIVNGLRYSSAPPTRSQRGGASPAEWKAWLCEPANSIILGACFMWQLNAKHKLKGDPVLIYAGYNAGTPMPRTKGTWGIVNYGVPSNSDLALENFIAYYGDACAVYAE